MEKFQKPSNFVRYTLSSESYKIYAQQMFSLDTEHFTYLLRSCQHNIMIMHIIRSDLHNSMQQNMIGSSL
jgi:hypothetical protein